MLVVDAPNITRFAKSRSAFAWVGHDNDGDGFVGAQRTGTAATLIATNRRRIKDVAVIDDAVLWCEKDEEDRSMWRGFWSSLDTPDPRCLGYLYAAIANGDELIALDLEFNQFFSFDRSGQQGRGLIDAPSDIANPAMIEQMDITRDRLYWSQPGDQTSLACVLSVPLGGGCVRVETTGSSVVTDLAAGPDSLILARIRLTGTSRVDATLSVLRLDDIKTEREIIRDDEWVYCPRIHGESVLWMRKRTNPRRRAQLVRKVPDADLEVLREEDYLWGLIIEGDDAWFASPRGIEWIDLSMTAR